MDEGLFLLMLVSGFILLAAIIYCFLSTCVGLQIRRSDIMEAFSLPSISQIQDRDRRRRERAAMRGGEFELDEMGTSGGIYDRPLGMGAMGSEEVEMLRRGQNRFF